MSNVIDSVPTEFRDFFVEVLTEHNPELLSVLRTEEAPTPEQKETVDDIFSDLIVSELGPGHVPTERGQLAKRTIEEFWFVWSSPQWNSRARRGQKYRYVGEDAVVILNAKR